MVHLSTYSMRQWNEVYFYFSFSFWYSWGHKVLGSNLLPFFIPSWGWVVVLSHSQWDIEGCVLSWVAPIVVMTVGAETAFSLLFQLTAAGCGMWQLDFTSYLNYKCIFNIKKENTQNTKRLWGGKCSSLCGGCLGGIHLFLWVAMDGKSLGFWFQYALVCCSSAVVKYFTNGDKLMTWKGSFHKENVRVWSPARRLGTLLCVFCHCLWRCWNG